MKPPQACFSITELWATSASVSLKSNGCDWQGRNGTQSALTPLNCCQQGLSNSFRMVRMQSVLVDLEPPCIIPAALQPGVGEI